MKKQYTKRYFEAYAMLSLNLILQMDFCTEDLNERPDIQSERLDVGVEVTRAITPEDGLFESICRKYLGRGLSARTIKRELAERYEEFHPEVTGDDTGVSIHPGGEPDDIVMRIEKLRAGIGRKLEKLNRGYRLFSVNGLYLFSSPGRLEDTAVAGLFSDLDFEQYPVGYDVYYINGYDRFYVYHVRDKRLERFDVSDRQLRELQKTAARVARIKEKQEKQRSEA